MPLHASSETLEEHMHLGVPQQGKYCKSQIQNNPATLQSCQEKRTPLEYINELMF